MICSLQKYREITHDLNSYDGDVTVALVAAQKLIESKTFRLFEKAERTEALKPRSDGRAYPKATPLVSVSAPTDAVVDGDVVRLTAGWTDTSMWTTGLSRGHPDQGDWDLLTISDTPKTLVTYIGGYEPEDMPEEIVEAVAELARIQAMKIVPNKDIPVGVTSIHVGDVSLAGLNLGQYQKIPATIRNTIRTWRRRDI